MIQVYISDLPLKDSKIDSNPVCKHPDKLTDPYCESNRGLRHHKQTNAFSSLTKKFKCNHSGGTSRIHFSHEQHEKGHKNGNKNKEAPSNASTLSRPVFSHKEFSSKDSEVMKSIKATDEKVEICNARALYMCRSCKKAFQTLSSLRRHQRRIHEHQPLPTGAFKNFRIPQETEGDQPVEMMTQDSPYNNPQDGECMVDISGKVSENLSFYIEGQIVSASSVHNCEVIEMNSGGSAAIGLNAVLISPSQVTQALKLETSASSLTPDLSGQFSTRRRTSTPPMLPPIKTETESESITSASPSPLPSLTVSGVPLGSTHLPQSIETVAGNKETTFYLSPKINDVLENPEGDKATFALIASGSNVGPPLTTTRFKRRTSSPPNSPIQTVELNEDKQDNDSTAPRMSKHESHRMNFLWSEETIPLISPMKSPAQTEQQILPLDSSVSMTYVNLCNQQPLDLSNSVCMPDEAILDLSLNGSKLEYDLAGINLAQSVLNSFKPSVFQNVFRNEQGVVDDNSFEGIASGEAPNLTAGLLSDTGPPNPEDFFFELGLPPTSINPMLAPLSILPAATFPPSSQNFESCLSAPVGEDTNDIQTQPSSISVSENDFEDIPLTTLSQQSDLKVTFPNWGFLAPGDMETQLPIASPHWVTDPSALAQRTLVVDSVFSSSLPINQSFPPNTVVIEYTVALHATEKILPILQCSSVECYSDKIPNDEALQQESHAPSDPALGSTQLSETELTAIEKSNFGRLTPVSSTASDNVYSMEERQAECQSSDNLEQREKMEVELLSLQSFCKNFTCNVCGELFHSMNILSQHIVEHSREWPFKCEFCVQLFASDRGLLEHRSSYHGIGKIYICKTCSKEFAFFSNLEQHQRDLHPGQDCQQSEAVHGRLRPENHNSPKTEITDPEIPVSDVIQESDITTSKAEKNAVGNNTEELFSTIKTLTSGGVKPKTPDVRLGINQHYPSFKPPPFPYHNQTPVETTGASATKFTTHNIPQTFSTAIRCTKCGKSFDNMPELHKHILACANANDKKRYTPKKNPIPLNQFAKAHGVLLPTKSTNARQNLSEKGEEIKTQNFHESPNEVKMSLQPQQVRRGRPAGGRKAFVQGDSNLFSCPHCSREFIYSASLKKHVAFSCPMRPASRIQRKRTVNIVSTQENHGRLRRQINTSSKSQTISQK